MTCLIDLCFISSVYISGSLGNQMTVDYDDRFRTNSYGYYIGELSLVVELKNNMFLETKHISGINTAESDYGLNAIMIGARINLFESK